MNTTTAELSDVIKLSKMIKEDFPKLTDHESLDIATKVIANSLYRRANVISDYDNYPTALENIAILMKENRGL